MKANSLCHTCGQNSAVYYNGTLTCFNNNCIDFEKEK